MTHEGKVGDHQGYGLLKCACILYTIGLVAHGADHLRRGTDVLTPEVTWAGAVTTIMGLILVALVFSGHRLAPLAAAAFGFGNAAGVTAVHLLPHWSAFSDAFPGGELGVEVTSWAAVLIEIVGLLMLGAAGTYVLTGGSAPNRTSEGSVNASR